MKKSDLFDFFVSNKAVIQNRAKATVIEACVNETYVLNSEFHYCDEILDKCKLLLIDSAIS